MERYIVRPAKQSNLGLATPAVIQLTPVHRSRQLAAAQTFRSSLPVFDRLDAWLSSMSARINRISVGPAANQATGAFVVEMSSDTKDELVDKIDDIRIDADQPISLIPPAKTCHILNEPSDDDLWHLSAVGLSMSNRRRLGCSGEGVTVAVLDTGIDASHAEFANKRISMTRFDVDNWHTTTTMSSIDTSGHGTHVAGLVAGRTVGVAPGAALVNAMMIPDGIGMLSDFVLAMEWAAGQPEVSIVNISAGIPGFIGGMEDVVEALRYVGVLPVIATGNEGRNQTRSPGNYRPVLSVGACDKHGRVAGFSSSGEMAVDQQIYRVPDLVAPGEHVVSCLMGGGFEAWDGTSMATPIVSGIAALILERHPTISVTNLTEAILEKCELLRNVSGSRQGYGRVNIKSMLPPAKKKRSSTKKATSVKKEVTKKETGEVSSAGREKLAIGTTRSSKKAGVSKKGDQSTKAQSKRGVTKKSGKKTTKKV